MPIAGRASARMPARHTASSPRRVASVTASVRLAAPSLVKSEPTWNFAVCSLIPGGRAIEEFEEPWADDGIDPSRRVHMVL